MLRPWPELSRKTLATLSSFEVLDIRRKSPRTGVDHDFFVIRCLDWVNVIALTLDGKIVLVRQWRHGSQSFTLEIPGGAVDPGEGMLAAARRELREESGYEAQELVWLGDVNPNAAIFGNRCGSVLARSCRRVGDIEPDPGEDLEVLELSPAEFRAAIRRGEVDHALVLAALVWLELHEGPESLFATE